MFKSSDVKKEDGDEIETSGPRMRKWLLLDRPEGTDGWIAHFLFHFCALAALVLKVRGVMVAVGALDDSPRWLALIYFTSASFFVLLMIYLRGVSQRLTAAGEGQGVVYPVPVA
jgi:hypothetical protein